MRVIFCDDNSMTPMEPESEPKASCFPFSLRLSWLIELK